MEDAHERFGGSSSDSLSQGGKGYTDDHHSSGPTTNINTGVSHTTSIVDTTQYVNNQLGLYFALYMTFSMGMLGTYLATNLIEFFVFFELMLVPSFFLIAFYGYGARLRIALMFFFWTHVGAVVLLLGLLAMGFFAGGFDYTTVKANATKIPTQWLSIIVFALVVGLGVKFAHFSYISGSICSCRSSYSCFSSAFTGNDRHWSIRFAEVMVGVTNRKLCPV